jgi:hypothetical protein
MQTLDQRTIWTLVDKGHTSQSRDESVPAKSFVHLFDTRLKGNPLSPSRSSIRDIKQREAHHAAR